MRKFTLAIVLIFTAVLISGCTSKGSSANSSTNSFANGQADTDRLQVTQGKPAVWPSDIDVPNEAYEYGYAKYQSTYLMGYKLPYSQSVDSVSSRVSGMLKSNGWKLEDENTILSDNASIQSLVKGENSLILTVSNLDTNKEYTAVSISMGPTADISN